MFHRKMRIRALSLMMSLTIMSLATGCESLRKQPLETETEKQTEKPTEKPTEKITETQSETETETETETELQKNVAYTSQDKSIRITLPDSTWKVTQDADEMRVFSSGSVAMINIVHADTESGMKNLSVAGSEEELTETLSKQYADEKAFEVIDFETVSSDKLNTYEYVVKYNSTSMWAYSVTYGILAEDEAYVITGTVTNDNRVLLNAVKKSVESFTVMNNSKFSTLPGSAVNKETKKEETESEPDAEKELKTLNDYGTTVNLYASDGVYVRLQPSTDADILDMLALGDQVAVVGETSQWFKVNINGNIGYVSKAFLVYNQTTSTEAPQQETPSSSTMAQAELNTYVDYGTSYTYYATTEVNLREQPGTDSNVVAGLGGGQAVTVVGETDNWYVVSVNGVKGYVSKSYVSSTYNPGQGDSTGGDNSGGNNSGGGNTGSDTPETPRYGTISGTIVDAGVSTIVIQGDDGNTYTLDYSDAAVDTYDGIYSGLYVSANVDYSGTNDGVLYATSVSGH